MRSLQPLQRILVDDPALAAWDTRMRRELALTCAVRNGLPRQLATRIRVVDAERETLEIVADSGAVAAAVRQRLPGVLTQLAKDGHEFTGIRVRVQVRDLPEIAPKSPLNPIDKVGISSLARLAADLAPGPLKTSLDRLLKRYR
jgi:hypothetical protein